MLARQRMGVALAWALSEGSAVRGVGTGAASR